MTSSLNMAQALTYAVSVVDPSEGFVAQAYLDKVARPPVWTIGHGTTRIDGKPVTQGMTCTLQQADLWAMSDMMAAAHFVLGCVKIPLNEPELGALISFTYNEGMGNFEHSSVLAAINQGDLFIAADRLLYYDVAGGRPVAGLLARRRRERALFLSGMGITPDLVAPPLAAAPLSDADRLNQAELEENV
jgi:lysozyme